MPRIVGTLHLMAEPLRHLGAGGHLLHPRIGSDGLLIHPSWPEALHQDPPAVSTRGRVIRALDPKHSDPAPLCSASGDTLFAARTSASPMQSRSGSVTLLPGGRAPRRNQRALGKQRVPCRLANRDRGRMFELP